jgi:hypothetical protein
VREPLIDLDQDFLCECLTSIKTNKGDGKMEPAKMYELPKLGYDYNALAPVISEDLLRLHHEK